MKISEESFWKPVVERAEGSLLGVWWHAGMNRDRALKLAHRYLEDLTNDLTRTQRLKSVVNRLDAFYRASDDDIDPRLKYVETIPEWQPYFAPLHELFGDYHLAFSNWWDGYYLVIRAENILRICEIKDQEIDNFNTTFDKSIDDVFKVPHMKGVPRTIRRLAQGYRSYIQQINEAFPL